MGENWMTSIGLDIGTSTTKFIVSRLLISETGNRFSLPSCEIIDRQVAYTSSIYTTPLKNQYQIDMEKIAEILEKEYKKSQITLRDVKAGAVIITGETARKDNAQTIIHYLAERAGDFVVATAGADLEGILAGKGSGAFKRSTDIEGVIANVDIGGGTANIVLFQGGRAIQTVTFHVGGRLIRLTEDGTIQYISDYIRDWLQANQLQIQIGDKATYSQLEEICQKMSHTMLSYLSGSPKCFPELLLLEPISVKLPAIAEIMISGGVGQMMDKERPLAVGEAAKHGDIGPLLAYTLTLAVKEYSFPLIEAKETIRATVIGAGMQNTEVSGATIHVNEALLPIKNIPILAIPVETNGEWIKSDFKKRLSPLFQQAWELYGLEEDPPFALALAAMPYCTYEILQGLAVSIVEEYQKRFPEALCLVVLCEQDMAKALGQAINKCRKGKLEVICVDQVDFTYGDYIDLGFPVAGEAISISVKTLAF